MNDLIFISIASYLDKELKQTVTSILQNAENPQNIFLSIYSQEKNGEHPDIKSICKRYGAGLSYIKDDFRNSKGTCYARSICQKKLNSSYKYYLQIDSHTIFTKHWDKNLIEDYEKARSKWDKLIFSTYPLCYYYNEVYDKAKMGKNLGQYFFEVRQDSFSNCLEIVTTKHFSRFSGSYIQYPGDKLGYETSYFAGGFAFGYSQYFIDTPYDPRIYHSGEEPTLSIRFYCKGISLVCPPRNYCYHHFSGDSCKRRQSHWIEDSDWEYSEHKKILDEVHRISEKTLNDFYNLSLNDNFGITDKDKYEQWLSLVNYEKDILVWEKTYNTKITV